ncbi:unnamed protein product, partial [Adineta ricciae]
MELESEMEFGLQRSTLMLSCRLSAPAVPIGGVLPICAAGCEEPPLYLRQKQKQTTKLLIIKAKRPNI